MTDTIRVAMVQCGNDKDESTLLGVSEPKPAELLYESGYFDKKRDYARIVCDDWWILSAKHGLIEDVTTPIGPYDASVEEMSDSEVERWATTVSDQLQAVDWTGIATLEVLAGESYVEPLRTVLEEVPCDVEYPFRSISGGHGKQMEWLKNQVERASEDALEW